MPYTSKHKKQTRQRILQAAATLFCSKGFDNVTLTQIMKKANMTHGAFYAYFSGKSGLYSAAMKLASANNFWTRSNRKTAGNKTNLKALITLYLRWSQTDKTPSPLEFLVTDSAHKEEKVRQAYQICFDKLVARLTNILKECGSQEAKSMAEETVISLVGVITIARSFNQPMQRDFIKRARERILFRLNDSLKTKIIA